jgi:hypothetical protein
MQFKTSFSFAFTAFRLDGISFDAISEQLYVRGHYPRRGKLIPWCFTLSYPTLNTLFTQHLGSAERVALSEAISEVLTTGTPAWSEVEPRKVLGKDLVFEKILFKGHPSKKGRNQAPVIQQIERIL